MSPPDGAPRAAILGCAGPDLLPEEASFFREADPLGFILFRRNCVSKEQVRRLTAALRAAVGRPDAPVLIDQEGGRVARLAAPEWPLFPAAGALGAIWERSPAAAREAAWRAGRLMAAELAPLGIDVDCAPVLDLHQAGAHDIIGDRAFGADPGQVAACGRALAAGLLDGGVLPVVKHMPGHGRATADSHHALPVVEASEAVLWASDFAPFRALADLPVAMTAHIVYSAIDAAAPATCSASVIGRLIRQAIGYDGFLVSDDLSMQALSGSLGERAAAAIGAGCDAVLHCNGVMAEMEEVAAATPPLAEAGRRRWARAAALRVMPGPIDAAAWRRRLDAILAGALR